MKINFHDLQNQYQDYKEEINQAVQKVFDSCQFIMGQEVNEFEKALSDYLDSPYVVSCASGTDALLLALLAIDIQTDDEIITSPFTFIATAEIIALLKAKPVFVDIQPDTYNLDPNKIKAHITKKTRAILPVALYGQPADMDEINQIAREYSKQYGHKIYVIEDAAQSLGAQYKGRKSANLSDIGCISFFPTKPLGCYGDGGAVVVSDQALAEQLKSLRVHGQTKRYYHKYIGFNARLDTLQAAILQVKLRYFNQEIKKRAAIANRYAELLSNIAVTLPHVKSDRTSVFAQYSIRSDNREHIISQLKDKNIPIAIHYPKPLHLQECFQYLGYQLGDFPVSEQTAQEIMSLPMSAFVTEAEQQYIADALREAVSMTNHA